MRAGDVADSVNHRQDHETERERDANVSDGTARNVVDDDRTCPGKDETERAETLGQQLLHFVHPVQQQPEVALFVS